MSQRFEGRNLEEALTSASAALGAERWQITYHVLLEKRGFLGGMKRVVIEAEVNEQATPPSAPAAPPAPVAPEISHDAPVVSYDAPVVAAAPAAEPPVRARSSARGRGGDDRGRGGRGRNDRGGRERGPRGGGGRREHSSDRYDSWEPQIPEQGPESDEALLVRGWCEEVIDLARFNLTVRTEENDTQIVVRMFGRDTRLLVDEHGELLDAIQVLANKALVGRKVTKEIELDANAFKERRIEELEERALEMAARVRIDGREQLLPPMTPIERRIIHVALHDDEEVTTVSRGEGFYKRVAILLRSEAEKETATPPQEP